MGNELSTGQLSDCDPIITNANLGKSESVDGTPLEPSAPAFPCGLVAKSYFNDTFELWHTDEETGVASTNITIADDDIAWESDVKYKFNNLDDGWEAKQWTDVTNQHFIVWMRTAGLPNFRKLYGKVTEDLMKGKYELRIGNNYNVNSFAGSKYFVLSTTNLLGGTNYFLAVCYIIVGALCIMFGIIFFIAYMGRKQSSPT